MQWFLNLPTRAKLMFGFGIMIVLMAIVVTTAYMAMRQSLNAQQRLYDLHFSKVIDLLTFDANNNNLRRDVLIMTYTTNRADIELQHANIRAVAEENAKLIQRLMESDWPDQALHRQLEDYGKLNDEIDTVRETQVIPLLKQGKINEAVSIAVFGIQRTNYMRLRVATRDILDRVKADAQTALQRSQQGGRQTLILYTGLASLALLTGFFLAAYLNKLISGPLQNMLQVAEKIASGELRGELPMLERHDEIGALNQTFRRMLDSLRDVNRQIQEGVNVLSTSASEILSATSEMASGAAQTAAAVTQTTTTVEEVKQTAGVSSQKARQVADMAARTVAASQEGRRSVDETITGMGRMRSQMDAIAESIVRLSEHSQAIGDIIATVNDLAERSNLLAVNAAIEAAKAGEQGKGFGVVAQEVRSLASQSKQATAQVRALLGNIQKATSSAVMVTEQGTRAVETAVQQSSRAGEAIRELAESIDAAAQAARQISASAEQQSIGMDQVAQAMESIKQAANQTANATRQTESGARDLHQLGQSLKTIVSRFRM